MKQHALHILFVFTLLAGLAPASAFALEYEALPPERPVVERVTRWAA